MLRETRQAVSTERDSGRSVLPRLSPRGQHTLFRGRAIPMGSTGGDSVLPLSEPAQRKKIAPHCPTCKQRAHLVSRDELHPFRDDLKNIPELYYACCGNIAPADSKTLKPTTRLHDYVSRRLRREAYSVFNRLRRLKVKYPRANTLEEHIRYELKIAEFNLATADAFLCRDVIRVCSERLHGDF